MNRLFSKRTYLKVSLLLLMAACFAVQATENNADFLPSLRISIHLSEPSDTANSFTDTSTQNNQPLHLRATNELGQLSALPHPEVALSLKNRDDLTETPAASQPSYGFAVAQYLLFAAVALGLLYAMRYYWISRKGFSPSTRYVSVKTKFFIALLSATLWACLSVYLAQYWFHELAGLIGIALAGLAILGIAIIPGFMNIFLVTSLLLDRRPMRVALEKYPPLTILIAAYNEATIIAKTLKSIALQNYPAPLEVLVIDDGSSDATAAIVTDEMTRYPWLRLLRVQKNGGKAKALNQGMAHASNQLIVTLDADSYLYADSLKSIVERYFGDPPNTKVVAGTVLVFSGSPK